MKVKLLLILYNIDNHWRELSK